MTGTDLPGAVTATLQALVHLGVAREMAALTGVSAETIYRHARQDGAKGRPARMDPETLRPLADLFLELGVLEQPSYGALRVAEDEIRRRATERAARAGVAAARRRRK